MTPEQIAELKRDCAKSAKNIAIAPGPETLQYTRAYGQYEIASKVLDWLGESHATPRSERERLDAEALRRTRP